MAECPELTHCDTRSFRDSLSSKPTSAWRGGKQKAPSKEKTARIRIRPASGSTLARFDNWVTQAHLRICNGVVVAFYVFRCKIARRFRGSPAGRNRYSLETVQQRG